VILTAHDAEDLFHASMDAGANGYLLKDGAYTEIVAAIRAVREGGYYVTKSMMGYLLNREQPLASTAPSADVRLRELSPVERRILSQIAQKKSSREIADEFGVSVRTIENRRASICEKLGLGGVNSLLKYALDHKSEIA
jgi:DNA-binding NarL/FixJ family response regulator